MPSIKGVVSVERTATEIINNISFNIGKLWFGIDQTEPDRVLFLDGGSVDGTDKEYAAFAAWLLKPEQSHMIDETNLAAFYVNPETYEIRLPDWRGLGLRIAGQSSAFTMSNGQPYDAGQALTVLLDQMQGHWHHAGSNTSGTPSLAFAAGYAENSNDRGKPAAPAQHPITDGTNGTPRTGSETRMATVSINVGVYYK